MFSPDANQENAKFEETKREVVSVLLDHGIPFENWGKGSAKTLEHLVREVLAGETTLEEGPAGELVRQVAVACVDVYYHDPSGGSWKLREEKQVFKDGRVRRRALAESIAEKLKAGEIPNQDLVTRALEEELGIEGEVPSVAKGAREVTQDSPSYPGLKMKLVQHRFETELSEPQYRPEGYVEHQADKDNYFVWERVEADK